MTGDLEAARGAKDRLVERLGADSRLCGIGLAPLEGAPGSYAVVVRVTEPAYASELDLPAAVDGVTVQVAVVGEVVALGGSSAGDLSADVPARSEPEPGHAAPPRAP